MHIRRGYLGWGVFLILTGAVPLLVRSGYLSEDQVDRLWTLWPLILIGIGVGLILSRTRFDFFGGLIVAATLGLMLGGLLSQGINVVSGGTCGSNVAGTSFPTRDGTFSGSTAADRSRAGLRGSHRRCRRWDVLASRGQRQGRHRAERRIERRVARGQVARPQRRDVLRLRPSRRLAADRSGRGPPRRRCPAERRDEQARPRRSLARHGQAGSQCGVDDGRSHRCSRDRGHRVRPERGRGRRDPAEPFDDGIDPGQRRRRRSCARRPAPGFDCTPATA